MSAEASHLRDHLPSPDSSNRPFSAPRRSASMPGCKVSTAASRFQAVERVILALRERLDEPISLQSMAAIALLSPYHFNRVFCQITGIPPCKFLTALRLEAAKRLLLTTELSVTGACFEVGYSSVGTFTSHFTQQVGLSPRSLRRLAMFAPAKHSAELGQCIQNWFRTSPEPNSVTGRVTVPGEFSGLVFVGLFTGPIPQGRPVGCALLNEPGTYQILSVPDGTYHLFAAAFPWSDDPLAYLLPTPDSAYVGAAPDAIRIDVNSRVRNADLALRPMQRTDPPILVALPFLLAEQLSVTGTVADRTMLQPA